MLMDTTNDGNDDAHRVSCDGCHSLRIYSDRYKCLQCEDYDLCGQCFEKQRETKQHKSGHAFAHFKVPMELFGEPIIKANEEVTLSKFKARFATIEHTNVSCDGCNTTPLIGIRFKCDTCRDYDLCLTCMEEQVVTNEHNTKHSLIVVGKDRLNQIDINDIELGDELGRGAFGMMTFYFDHFSSIIVSF
jgi:next-to-BRCA1 protein 1